MRLINVLKEYPKGRERRHRDKAIAYLLIEQHRLDMTPDELAEIISRVPSLHREWRKILELNPELRGKDYNDKSWLTQRKQIDLGYEAGYHRKVKKLTQHK